MALSKPKKILIGVLTAWVIFDLFLDLAMTVTFVMEGEVLPIVQSVYGFFKNIFILTTLIRWGLLVFYIFHIFKNNAASRLVRAVLGLGILFWPILFMPIYYYMFIWRDQPPVMLMKTSRSKFVDLLIIGSLAAILGLGGLTVASFQFIFRGPPWQYRRLPSPPPGTAQILQVQLASHAEDPKGDTVFVETDNGRIYRYTLFEDTWLAVEDVPDSSFQISDTCAPDWPGAQSSADIWDPPPVEKDVRDSAGERIEHSLAIIVRCYVLSEDGSFGLWKRDYSALGILLFMQCAPFYVLAGIILGIVVGYLIVRIRNKIEMRTVTPANTE